MTIELPNNKETETIAKMLQSFDNEALPEEQHPFSFYLEKAQSFINCNDTHKVWRDKNTDITSIAYFTPVETNEKIQNKIPSLPIYVKAWKILLVEVIISNIKNHLLSCRKARE